MHDRRRYREDLDSAAEFFDEFAEIFESAAEEISERLQDIRCSPERALDAGCRNGRLSRLLRASMPDAAIYSVDESGAMASRTSHHGIDASACVLIADLDRLPFGSNTLDLVVSNMAASFYPPADFLSECHRVLRPGGVLMFAAFGPDTFRELRRACSPLDDVSIECHFSDMHDLGDLLVQTGFANPVVDIELQTYSFRDVKSVFEHLSNCGIHSVLSTNSQQLFDNSVQSQLETEIRKVSGNSNAIILSVEIVYGVAWVKDFETGSARVEFDGR